MTGGQHPIQGRQGSLRGVVPSEWRYWGKGAQPNSAGPLPAALLGPLVSHPSIDLYMCISEPICALYAERTAVYARTALLHLGTSTSACSTPSGRAHARGALLRLGQKSPERDESLRPLHEHEDAFNFIAH